MGLAETKIPMTPVVLLPPSRHGLKLIVTHLPTKDAPTISLLPSLLLDPWNAGDKETRTWPMVKATSFGPLMPVLVTVFSKLHSSSTSLLPPSTPWSSTKWL